MAVTPSTAAAPSPGEDPTDPAQAAAAARAAREEALRIILGTPDKDPPPSLTSRAVPVIHVATTTPDEPTLPYIPSATRAASHPWTSLQVGLLLLIVVLAIALTFMVADEIRGRVRAGRSATELRTLAAALESYRREAGEWPATVPAHAALPANLKHVFPADLWSRPTPFGGHYAWVRNARADRPALAITAFVPDAPLTLSPHELRRIDRLLDDGDLATGRFQTGFNGWPVYFIGGEN